MYCEQIASINAAGSEHHSSAMLSIMDFWGRVTPGVLQLLSHTKVVSIVIFVSTAANNSVNSN